MSGKFRAARFALALAPIIALMACDQIGRVLEQVGAPELPGPVALSSVGPDARSMGGAMLLPAEAMALIVAPEPVKFVPGEILIGAKVDDELAQAANELGMRMMSRLAPDGSPQMLDQRLEAKAVENAVEEATRDARTVLDRLNVDGAILVSPSGMVKIDLTPANTASPIGLPRFAQRTGDGVLTPPPGAEPTEAGAPAQPVAVVDTGQRCPRNVTTVQLDADLTLKTICAMERLQASRQFEFVEKNYIINVEFDRLPFFSTKKDGATTPASTAPGTTAPSAPANPNAELAATGALPNDPLLTYQWALRARGAGAGQSPGGAGFDTYWTNARQVGRRSVRVAVIDTGIELAHPDMRNNANIGPGIDLIVDYDRAGDGNGIDSDPNDVGDACGTGKENSYHGTHVAGTVGAAITNDKRGVAGGAWNVTIIPIRAIGRCGGELEDIVNAIRWASGIAPAMTETGEQIVNANPADIINMSLSVQIPCPASMQSAIDAAVARGAVIVVAAGNKSNAVANYAPANCNNVITVAANDARGAIAFYSNFGPGVDILAPGGDVFADSDGDGRPDGVLSTRTTTKDCYDPETRQPAQTCHYGFLQGTSMAAPHVAAALALLQSQYNVRGKDLEALLLTRALGPIDANAQCSIECARNANATPIASSPGRCMRQCGRGMLDLARAAPTVTPAISPAAAPPAGR